MTEGEGHYLGTEIDGKWYRRFMAPGFFARGKGRWRIADGGLYFKRIMLREELCIPFPAVTGVRRGAWHSGQWLIRKVVVKVDWRHEGQDLCSGFVFGRTPEQAVQMASYIESQAARVCIDEGAPKSFKCGGMLCF